MKSTIDAAGRVVIPKAIRRQAGLGPGAAVDIRFENGQIEIEPLSVPIKLVQEGQLLVAVPRSDVPPLTSNAVELTLDSLRRVSANSHSPAAPPLTQGGVSTVRRKFS